MQILRTILWVLLLVALGIFAYANWEPTVTVRIWEGLLVDTKIPAIVIFSFAIGFVPMWLYHRASKWKLRRRIAALEVAARTAAETPTAARTGYVPDRTESESLAPAPEAPAAEPTDETTGYTPADPTADQEDESKPNP